MAYQKVGLVHVPVEQDFLAAAYLGKVFFHSLDVPFQECVLFEDQYRPLGLFHTENGALLAASNMDPYRPRWMSSPNRNFRTHTDHLASMFELAHCQALSGFRNGPCQPSLLAVQVRNNQFSFMRYSA